jgi:tetratricopeptide (TPR) repeat protein
MRLATACLAVAIAGPARSQEPAPMPPLADEPPAISLDDPLEPLAEERPRTEEDQDRVDADALAAHGRLLFQQGDLERALRRYQRAWRYNSENVSILKDIIPLALKLNRSAEAARYAVISAEKSPTDVALLRNLASLLASQGDYERALSLFERSYENGAAETTAETEKADIDTRLAMGRLYFLVGDFPRAADAFAMVQSKFEKDGADGLGEEARQALAQESADTYGLFAETYLRAGRHDQAATAFRKANEARPDAALLAFRLARVETGREAFAPALALLDESLAAGPLDEGEEPYQLLGDLLRKTATPPAGDDQIRKQLIDRLAAAQATAGNSEGFKLFLARQWSEAGAADKAIALLEEAHGAQPALETTVELAAALAKAGRHDRLLAVLGQAALLQGAGDALAAIVTRGAIDAATLEAIRAEAKARGDALRGAALALGVLSVKLGQEGDEWFEAALKQSPPKPAETLITWGLELYFAKKYDAAAKVFARAIKENVARAQNAALYYYLAGAHEEAGRTEEALAALKRAAALNSSSAEYRMRAALILERAKRYDEAEQELVRLIERLDKARSPAARDARRMLSNLYDKMGRMPEAEEQLEQVLDEYPDDDGALNDLGYLWVDQNKRLKRSLAMIERACAAEPGQAAYRDSLGWAYYRLGRFDEAVVELEKAVALESQPDAVILDHLGDARASAGQGEKALEAWRKAAEAARATEDGDLLEKIEAKIKARE